MAENIHLNNISYPSIVYFIPLIVFGVYIIVFIISLSLYFKHFNRIDNTKKIIAAKITLLATIIFVIIVQFFYIILQIIELISHLVNYDTYLDLYHEGIWGLSAQILSLPILILLILYAHSFSYFIQLSYPNEQSNRKLILILKILFAVFWSVNLFISSFFADYSPYIVGKLTAPKYGDVGDSIVGIVLSTISILLIFSIFLITNKNKSIILEYEKVSSPLRIYSLFSLFIFSLIRIGWFAWGVIFTEAMPDNYAGNINVILFYGYLIIRLLMSCNYLVFFFEISLKFRKVKPEQYEQIGELE